MCKIEDLLSDSDEDFCQKIKRNDSLIKCIPDSSRTPPRTHEKFNPSQNLDYNKVKKSKSFLLHRSKMRPLNPKSKKKLASDQQQSTVPAQATPKVIRVGAICKYVKKQRSLSICAGNLHIVKESDTEQIETDLEHWGR